MQLIFVHGWGFDASFWDDLAAHLPEYRKRRVDLGFYSYPKSFDSLPEDGVLIGHSLGFMYGIQQAKAWKGWVAINSFARFVDKPSGKGCVPDAVLQNLKMRLAIDPQKALRDFYALIKAKPLYGTLDSHRLAWGLDILQEGDVSVMIENTPVPSLVLASRNDPIVPVAASQALAVEGSPVFHDQGGHVLPQTNAAFCAQHIRDFLHEHFG